MSWILWIVIGLLFIVALVMVLNRKSSSTRKKGALVALILAIAGPPIIGDAIPMLVGIYTLIFFSKNQS
jgi:lipopolysaccharide export LptBFGC system permease protein LptF